MPILNAATTSWCRGNIAYPFVDPITNQIQWGVTPILLEYLNISRIVDRSPMSLMRGGPYPNAWKFGDSYWEIEFKTPMLAPFYMDPDTSQGGFFDPSIVCATLPLTQITGETFFKPLILTGFVAACLRPYVMLTPPESIKSYWNDEENGHHYDRDIIVTNVTVNIGEEDSSLTVKLISTTNPRELFYLTDQILAEQELRPAGRVSKPFDVYITEEYVGGPIVISEPQGTRTVPIYLPSETRYTDYLSELSFTEEEGATGASGPAAPTEGGFSQAGSPGYIFMPRSLQFSIDTEIKKMRSVGVPSSRPLLIADGVSVKGSMKFVPFYRDEAGNLMHTDPSFVAPTDPGVVPFGINQPAGWMADVQAMDDGELTDRLPGKYYRSFEKSPSVATSKPLYLGFAVKDGLGGNPFWGVDGKSAITPLGAVSINKIVSTQQAGTFHELSFDFTTDPGNLV